MINYAALKAELINDPNAYGYAPLYAGGDNSGLADMLNTVRDGTNGTAISVKRANISPQEVLEAVDTRDFKANPSILEGSWFESITQYPSIRLLLDDGNDTRVMANLKRILLNTNNSQTRVTALGSRNGSRAEQLFGTNTSLTNEDIAKARLA